MSRYDNQSARKKMHYSPNLLACLNNAIENRVVVDLEYDSSGNELTKRKVEPMALIYKNRKRNLVAFCRLRNDWRTFRLDRIELVKLNSETFAKRDGFNLSDFEGEDNTDEEYEEEDDE
ncbi:MAG: WYL domain-containing protein [Chitinophagales bacterium]|nr:WYL domain-containing protein [Bacteroidota bacterium]MCB9227227.1 WYL domain-containing protein [Chitinophagales bacterium]